MNMNPDHEVLIREADVEDINTIGFLAQVIWPIAYSEILSQEQLQYMLKMIYSPASLKKQMQEDHHHFMIAELDEEPVGFCSYARAKEEGIYKLHKLYVRTDIQGKGLGKALLNAVIDEIKPLKATALDLNVNRHNKAKIFYEKLGFSVLKEEDIDIGGGYFMNDFVMRKKL